MCHVKLRLLLSVLGCKIDSQGVKELISSLFQHKTVRTLDISANFFNDECWLNVDFIQKYPIEKLYRLDGKFPLTQNFQFSANEFSDEMLAQIVEASKSSVTLKEFEVAGTTLFIPNQLFLERNIHGDGGSYPLQKQDNRLLCRKPPRSALSSFVTFKLLNL